MKTIKGSITTPKGFSTNGMHCGIKRSKPDLGIIISDVPAVSAGVFTKNSIKAAPLVVSIHHLKDASAQAMIVNSGNANCFTGKFGLTYAKEMTKAVAKILGIPMKQVLVTSTGIIGKPLPIKKILAAIPKLVKGVGISKNKQFAKSILTTDLTTKECCVQINLSGKTVTIGGCAKGSGMVAPNMATMLGFITTDAKISKTMLTSALKEANEKSFNCITIDGCMSTNDLVVVMANGLADNAEIKCSDQDYQTFCEALTIVCLDLAKKIVLDGEGATKFIEVQVKGGKTAAQAKKIGLTIANSNLVKTAAYGSNPNWGRVAAAVGSLGIKAITEERLKINFSPFTKKHIVITVNVNCGKAEATVFTSDLSREYIRINGEYN